MTLPTDKALRKMIPLQGGLLDYFPDACAAVAHCSYVGNEQHNPGQPLHWDRSKSADQEDALLRHFMERGLFDTDGVRHSAKVAWRALAALQLEIEHGFGNIWDYPTPVTAQDFRALTVTEGCTCDYCRDRQAEPWTDEEKTNSLNGWTFTDCEYDEAHFLNDTGYRPCEGDNIYAWTSREDFSNWEYDEAHSLNTWTFLDEEYRAACDDNLMWDIDHACRGGLVAPCPYDDQGACDCPNALGYVPPYDHVPPYDSIRAARDIAKCASQLAQDCNIEYPF